MPSRTKGWALTDVGRTRDHNEDSFLCNEELSLYAVADGMGGHLGGERASRMAVEIFEREVAARIASPAPSAEGATTAGDPGPVGAALRQAVRGAAASIYAEAQADAHHAGMGTTLTGGLFHGDHLTICHVGDSRVYLYRDGRARQLTEDHSWIQEQVRAGLLTPDDALVSRFRNIITRSVGFEPVVEPDVLTVPVEPGDVFVFCTDGLSNHLSAEDIAQVLTTHFYGEAAQALIDVANERAGDDNITCVIVSVSNGTAR